MAYAGRLVFLVLAGFHYNLRKVTGLLNIKKVLCNYLFSLAASGSPQKVIRTLHNK
jgi:hypothetical protein